MTDRSNTPRPDTPADVRTVAQWLRDRAESYARDARTLQDNPELVVGGSFALAYRTVADELRRCAAEIPASVL
jgi:hypothetical protein